MRSNRGSPVAYQQDGDTILSLFHRRKESFIKSLQHILSASASDKFILQMFEDSTSAVYIPDRICELIERYLQDDREYYINELYAKIQSLEACLGVEKLQNLEEIGKKRLDLMQNPTSSSYLEKQNNHALRELLKSVQRDTAYQSTMSPTNSFRSSNNYSIKGSIQDVSDYTETILSDVQNLTQGFKSEIAKAKTQVHSFVIASIGFRKEAALKQQELRDEINRINHKYNDIDIPNLRKRYENEITQHIANEENLSKQVSILKRRMEKLQKSKEALEDQLSHLRNQLVDCEGTIGYLSGTEQKAELYEGQVSALENELISRRQQIDSLVTEQQGTTSLESSLQNAMSNAKATLAKKEAEISSLKKEINKLKLENEEKSHSQAMYEADIQMLNLKLTGVPTLESELNEAKEKVQTLESSNRLLKDKLKDMQNNLSSTEEQFQKMKSDFQTFIDSKSSKDQLRQEIDSLNEELSLVNKQNGEKDKELFDKDQEIANLQKLLKINIDENRENHSSFIQAQNDLSDASTKIKSMQEENSSLTEKLEHNEELMEVYQKKIKQCENKIAELMISKSENDSTNAQLRVQLASLQEELKNTSITLAENEEELAHAKDELVKKNSAIEQFSSSGVLQQKEKAAFAAEIEKLHQESNKQKSLIRQNELQMKRLNQNIQKRDDEIQKLQDSILQSDAKIKELSSKNEELMRKIETHKENNKQYQSNEKELKNQIKMYKEKIKTIQEESDEAQKQIENLKKEQMKITSDRSMMMRQMDEERVNYRAEIEKQKKAVLDINSEKLATEQKLAHSEFEVRSLTQSLKQKEKEMEFHQSKNDIEVEDLKGQKKTLSEELSKAKTKLTNFDEKIKNLQKQISKVVPIDSIDELPGIITDLTKKNKEHEKNIDNIRKVMSVSQEVNLEDFSKTLKKNHDSMKKREDKLLEIFPGKKASELPDLIKKTKLKKDRLNDLTKNLKKTFNANNEELLKKAEKTKKASDQFMKQSNELSSILPNVSFDSLPTLITDMKTQNEEMKKREEEMFNISNSTKPLTKQFKEMKSTIDEIEEIVPIKEIKKMKKEHDDLINNQKEYQAMIPDDLSGHDFQSQLDHLIKRHQTLQEVEEEGFDENIPSKVKEMKKKIEKIEEMIPNDIKGDIIERLKQMIDERNETQELVGESTVKQLKEALDSTADFISHLYAVFTSKLNKISLPLPTTAQQKFLSTLAEFKSLADSSRSAIEAVLSKAKAMGFVGMELSGAITYMIESSVSLEKQKCLETMHKELTNVRNINEKERLLAEKQREKLKSKIKEQRNEFAQLQEKMSQREQEVVEEVLNEQKKARIAIDKFEREKRIHEELIRVIAGQVADNEYLSLNLSVKELQIIQKKKTK